MDDRRVKRVDEWQDVCAHCERPSRLVLLERGPRWTVRELFGREWDARRGFSVHCRACRTSMPVPGHLLDAALHGAFAGDEPSVRQPLAVRGVPGPRPALDGGRVVPEVREPAGVGAAH